MAFAAGKMGCCFDGADVEVSRLQFARCAWSGVEPGGCAHLAFCWTECASLSAPALVANNPQPQTWPLQRLVGCAQEKLGQNYGPQVHTLLHGLGLMGLRASDRGEQMAARCRVLAFVWHAAGICIHRGTPVLGSSQAACFLRSFNQLQHANWLLSYAGPVTHEFVLDCVDSQLGTAQQPQHLARLIGAGAQCPAVAP